MNNQLIKLEKIKLIKQNDLECKLFKNTIETIFPMMAEFLNCLTDAIQFGLLIVSYDCDITASILHVGHSIKYIDNCDTLMKI